MLVTQTPLTAPRVNAGNVPASTALGMVVFTILGALLPGLLIANVSDVDRSNAWRVTLVIMIWAAARLALLVGRGEARLFSLFFWLYVYIFLGLAATVQIRSGEIAGTTPGMDPSVDSSTAFLVVLGLAAYELGWLAAAQRRKRQPGPVDVAVTVAPRAVRAGPVRTVLLFTAGSLVAGFFLSRVGLSEYFVSRDAATAAGEAIFPDPAVLATLSAAALYPLLIVVGTFLQLRRTTAIRGRRRLFTLGIAISLSLILANVSPISTARYTLGTVVFALAVYLGAVKTKARTRITMMLSVIGFLFVFPIADAFRRQGVVSDTRDGFFGEYRGNGDYDSFWQIANANSYWHSGDAAPLRQAFGSLTFWVPRSVWPGKPTDTGILLAHFRGYHFDNLSAPLWAEALVNGGAVLLVAVFLVLGYAVWRLDTKILGSVSSGGPWAVVGAVFPVFATILLRGSLLQATGALAVSAASVVLVSAHWPRRRDAATHRDQGSVLDSTSSRGQADADQRTARHP